MEILNYSLIAIAAVLSLICGAIIGHFAKEELEPGKKYFIFLQKALFAAIIAVIMYANRTNVHYAWIGAIIIFAYLYFFEKINQAISYAVLGLAFFLAADTELFLPIASLAFLYGLPTGSRLVKNRKSIILCTIIFIAIAFLLYIFNQKL